MPLHDAVLNILTVKPLQSVTIFVILNDVPHDITSGIPINVFFVKSTGTGVGVGDPAGANPL